MAFFSATPNTSQNPFGGTGRPEQYGSLQAGGQSPVTIQAEPEVDYSYYFSPAHRARRSAEARKIGERAGEPIIHPGLQGLVNAGLADISRLPKVPAYEELMAEYDAERADLPPVSGPFPTIRNEYFRMQGDQLQYRIQQIPTVLNGYSRGAWINVDDSPAIRRLASTPNLYASFYPRGGRGAEYTYWKRAIQEAVANPNKGPGPQQRSLGIGGRVYAQNRALLERPDEGHPLSGILTAVSLAAPAFGGFAQTGLGALDALTTVAGLGENVNPFALASNVLGGFQNVPPGVGEAVDALAIANAAEEIFGGSEDSIDRSDPAPSTGLPITFPPLAQGSDAPYGDEEQPEEFGLPITFPPLVEGQDAPYGDAEQTPEEGFNPFTAFLGLFGGGGGGGNGGINLNIAPSGIPAESYSPTYHGANYEYTPQPMFVQEMPGRFPHNPFGDYSLQSNYSNPFLGRV